MPASEGISGRASGAGRTAALVGAAAWLAASGVAPFAAADPRNEARNPTEARTSAGDSKPGGLSFEADEATIEARPGGEKLELEGGVVLRAPRFRLEAERLALERGAGALELRGEARLGLCSCPDPPLAFGASGARYEDGDLWLDHPRLLLLGAPVLGLPFVWLRAPDRAGLLPPWLERRGDAGWLVGAGLFAPLGARAGAELRAGAFTEGGFEASGRLSAPGVRLGALHATGRAGRTRLEGTARLDLDATGVPAADPGRGGAGRALSLRVDLLRGAGARAATPELDVAAMPHDVASLEASLRGKGDGARARPLVALGLAARGRRASPAGFPPEDGPAGASGPLWLGPTALVDVQGALGSGISYAAWTRGASLAEPGQGEGAAGASAFGEVGASASAAGFWGALLASAETRERLRALVLRPGDGQGAAAAGREAVASARLGLSLPMARAFGAVGDGEIGDGALVHLVEPALEARVFAVHARGLGPAGAGRAESLAPGRGAPPASGFALGAGASTALGRYAGPSAFLEARAGAALASTTPEPAAFARAGVGSERLGLSLEAFGLPRADAGALSVAARASRGLASAHAELVLQRGAPGLARLLEPGPGSALPGDDVNLLVVPGASARLGFRAPLGSGLGARAGLDVDLDPPAQRAPGAAFSLPRLEGAALVAARGGLGFAHACGCLAVDLEGARRVGRGLDVLVKLELVPSAP